MNNNVFSLWNLVAIFMIDDTIVYDRRAYTNVNVV